MCLTFGESENHAYQVTYNKDQTILELRNAISKTIKYEPNHHLLLYKVDIDLTTTNAQRAALDNPNANIVNDLGGQKLKIVDKIEDKFPKPTNKHIHVIVKLPVGKRRKIISQ